MIQEGAADSELHEARKAVSKAIRKDRREHSLNLVNKDLDLRDQFSGLKYLRNPFIPIPLSMKDKNGAHVPLKDGAQTAEQLITSARSSGATRETRPKEFHSEHKDRKKGRGHPS